MLNISAPLLVYRSGRRLYFALLFQKQVKCSRQGTSKRLGRRKMPRSGLCETATCVS